MQINNTVGFWLTLALSGTAVAQAPPAMGTNGENVPQKSLPKQPIESAIDSVGGAAKKTPNNMAARAMGIDAKKALKKRSRKPKTPAPDKTQSPLS